MRRDSARSNFADRVVKAVRAKDSAVIVGLDPDVRYLPEELVRSATARFGHGERAMASAVATFNEALLTQLAEMVPAVKPQLAYYEALGPAGLAVYRRTVETAKRLGLIVIADAKRADIGATSEAYARAFFGPEPSYKGRKPRWTADALTVQPYLGRDGIEPLIARCDSGHGLFVLVRTSNPGAGELQDLRVLDTEGSLESRALYRVVGEAIRRWGLASVGDSGYSAVGAVVGATSPEALRELRGELPGVLFLIPGFGAQGGAAEDLRGAFDAEGQGALVNSSRGIIFAFRNKPYRERFGGDYAGAARAACADAVVAVNQVRGAAKRS